MEKRRRQSCCWNVAAILNCWKILWFISLFINLSLCQSVIYLFADYFTCPLKILVYIWFVSVIFFPSSLPPAFLSTLITSPCQFHVFLVYLSVCLVKLFSPFSSAHMKTGPCLHIKWRMIGTIHHGGSTHCPPLEKALLNLATHFLHFFPFNFWL